ncbi:CPXCG motif-containing cysteine-rich protein [Pseudoxanthomonas mexicana]|uniref:CPXCG motif-containing cysteine-rich protein n=1 Tax=Pseudoxanthomonas mexicana TaxID=128785 RepID=UPI00398A665C
MPALPALDLACPYCGETITVLIDDSGLEIAADAQRYVEDCQVCCRPIDIACWRGDDGEPRVSASAQDEA